MYNWATQNDIVEANPVAGVAKPGREQSRERVLLEDEIRRFFGLRATHNSACRGVVPFATDDGSARE